LLARYRRVLLTDAVLDRGLNEMFGRQTKALAMRDDRHACTPSLETDR
jgi:hypothetical protein